MNDDELATTWRSPGKRFFQLRFQLAMGKQDNSSRLGHVRREVARVLTLQRERRTGRSQPVFPGHRGKTRKGAR